MPLTFSDFSFFFPYLPFFLHYILNFQRSLVLEYRELEQILTICPLYSLVTTSLALGVHVYVLGSNPKFQAWGVGAGLLSYTQLLP